MKGNEAKILIVDDEKNIRKMISIIAREMGHECFEAGHPMEAFAILNEEKIDIIICDIKMPFMDGMECLKKIRSTYKSIPVIMLTGHGSISLAVEALKLGAADFMEKTADEDKLREKVSAAIESRKNALIHYSDDIFDAVHDKKMHKILKEAAHVAASDASIMLYGEHGVGKDVLARFIHKHSHAASGEFVTVGCGAIPESLFESEIMGYEKGAFTGADASKKGLCERAHGGTLFLDELGDLPLRNQAALLRILQDKKIHRLGGKIPIDAQFRVIAATNKHIPLLVSRGLFREDLYYRMNVVEMTVPPLRERKKDIVPLAQFFIASLCNQYGLEMKSLHEDLEKYMLAYPWPGNIRELRNFIERLLIVTDGTYLYYDDAHFLHTNLNLDSFLATQEKEILSRVHMLTGGNAERSARILGISSDEWEKRMERYEANL